MYVQPVVFQSIVCFLSLMVHPSRNQSVANRLPCKLFYPITWVKSRVRIWISCSLQRRHNTYIKKLFINVMFTFSKVETSQPTFNTYSDTENYIHTIYFATNSFLQNIFHYRQHFHHMITVSPSWTESSLTIPYTLYKLSCMTFPTFYFKHIMTSACRLLCTQTGYTLDISLKRWHVRTNIQKALSSGRFKVRTLLQQVKNYCPFFPIITLLPIQCTIISNSRTFLKKIKQWIH